MGVIICDLFAQDVLMFCLGLKSAARFVTRNLYGGKIMSTNPEFVEFVVSKLEELSKKFKLKNEQYTGETSMSKCGELANFRIGALLKYGQAGYSFMYECAKDYVRKHIAYIESHCVYADSVEESLGDIAIYAVIMMYMKECYEEERKMQLEQIKAEAK